MNNKLIWKGIDSSTIKGLLICELPPITKPKMRVQETIVDGVDGSIIEELGYESYDKSIKIGLTYGFDIDEVIKYFSGEGEIVFSNEPDKYYKAKIINRIDYERLLRFREATVKFRVQPFKYEYQEEEQTIATGSIEGTEIKINNVKATEIKVDGRSKQDGEPTPDTPVEIDSVGYENLIEPLMATATVSGITCTNNGDGSFTLNGTATADSHFRLNQSTYDSTDNLKTYNGDYTLSCEQLVTGVEFWLVQASPWKIGLNITENQKVANANINITDAFMYVRVVSGTTLNNLVIKPMLEKGSVAHSYIPYGKYGIEVKTIGENILNNTKYELGGYGDYGNKFYAEDNYRFSEPVEVKGGETLYFSKRLCVYYDIAGSDTTNNLTKVVPQNATKIYVRCFANDFSTFKPEDYMISRTPITELKSYKKNASVIVLNEPLRSLPNGVKDIAYIRNNKLYVDRKVGSLILNGSEDWLKSSYSDDKYFCGYLSIAPSNCAYDVFKMNDTFSKGLYSEVLDKECMADKGQLHTRILANRLTENSANGFKTWLSTHNVQVDYELATPVTEELGDITILQLLDGENNISNSADTNMVIDYAEILKVNNTGNYISKPIFEIEGVGNIKFILNGYSVFTYNFDEDGRVVIDSEKEDAYLGSVLKNRNMNGEFPKLELGENIITWEGLVKSIKVVKKSRWL